MPRCYASSLRLFRPCRQINSAAPLTSSSGRCRMAASLKKVPLVPDTFFYNFFRNRVIHRSVPMYRTQNNHLVRGKGT